LIITDHPVGLTGSKPFTTWFEIFKPTHTTNTDEFLVAITITLAPFTRVADATEVVIMADHPIRAIPIVSTNFWIIALTHAPVINAFGIIATIAIRTAASIDFTAHVINAALSITAITVFATTLNNNLIFNATIGLFITHLTARTCAIVTAIHALIIHWHTDILSALDFLTLRPFRTISVTTTGD